MGDVFSFLVIDELLWHYKNIRESAKGNCDMSFFFFCKLDINFWLEMDKMHLSFEIWRLLNFIAYFPTDWKRNIHGSALWKRMRIRFEVQLSLNCRLKTFSNKENSQMNPFNLKFFKRFILFHTDWKGKFLMPSIIWSANFVALLRLLYDL